MDLKNLDKSKIKNIDIRNILSKFNKIKSTVFDLKKVK